MRTDPDVEDAIRAGRAPAATRLLGWYSPNGGEIGDIPIAESHGDIHLAMKEVPLADGGTAPVQLMWSNRVGGPEGAADELTVVGAAAAQDRGAAARAERDRFVEREPVGEPEGQPGGEAVAAAVRVLDRARQRRRAERAARADPAAERARRRDDDARRRLEPAGLEALRRVLAAADEHVDLLGGALQRRELARGRDEHGRTPRAPKRGDVAADEVDGVAARELLPRQRRILARRDAASPEHGDRALAVLVDVRVRAPLRLARGRGVHVTPRAASSSRARRPSSSSPSEVKSWAEPLRFASCTAATAPPPAASSHVSQGVDDLARRGHMVDPDELDPLHVPDDRDVHELTSCASEYVS